MTRATRIPAGAHERERLSQQQCGVAAAHSPVALLSGVRWLTWALLASSLVSWCTVTRTLPSLFLSSAGRGAHTKSCSQQAS